MTPDWDRYYRETSPIPLREHHQPIIEILRRIRQNSLHQPPLTFALGGIHPNVTSAFDFVDICQQVYPEPDNRHIIFDIHPEAISCCGKEAEIVVDDLTRLDRFPDGSIDFLILHFTLMFLDEQQLEPTNHALNRVISPQGFVFVFIEERGLRNCFGLWNPNHVPTHYHPTQKLLSRLKSFKPSLICYCHPETDLLILTHTQSPYPTHTGDPLDFEHYH